MKILIISSQHLSHNPRVLKEAGTLARAGHDVTVLNVRNSAPAAAMDEALLAAAPFRCVAAVDFLSHPLSGFLQRGLSRLAREARRRLGWESAWALGSARALWRAARRMPADLTIVHVEPALWAGMRLMRMGRRVAVDFEDWYSENLLEADRRYLPIGLIRASEAALLRHGAFATAPSAAMARALAGQYGAAAPAVIHNSFPLQPASTVRFAPDRESRPAAVKALWFSHTIGPGRGLRMAIEALLITRCPWELHLLGTARPGYIESLTAGLPSAVRARVISHAPVPPSSLPEKIAAFDLGLALEPAGSRNNDLTISNKLLQYFNAGLGVIATDTAGQREAMQDAAGAGRLVPVESAPAVAAALDEILSQPAALPAMGRAARIAAEKTFCWEKMEPRILARIAHSFRRSGAV